MKMRQRLEGGNSKAQTPRTTSNISSKEKGMEQTLSGSDRDPTAVSTPGFVTSTIHGTFLLFKAIQSAALGLGSHRTLTPPLWLVSWA